MAGKKVSRNAPCPCGSGKKFKKCCANKSAGWSHSSSKVRLPKPKTETDDLQSLLRQGPAAIIDQKLKSIARSCPDSEAWKARIENLSKETPPEERALAFQGIRDAGVLPEEAGFFLIGWMMERLSTTPPFDEEMPQLDPDEASDEEWEQAFDTLLVGLLRRFGEEEMATLFSEDRMAYDRRYERGRQFFHGPPNEEYAKVLKERGVIE